MADLDALLADVDPDLAAQIREAVYEEAQNPDLVKGLRAQIDTLSTDRDALRREKQVAVLTEAGIPEKAHDRFLRDWNSEKNEVEFTKDNVIAAADDWAVMRTTADGTPPPVDAAEQQRREAAQRQAALRTEGHVETGVPPDAAAQRAAAEAAITPGNRSAISESLALKRKQLAKVAADPT
jgi:hypothetical protein